jgi:organic radical activating enzyme
MNPSESKDALQLPEIREGLRRIYAYGCRLINFTGGEPTLRSDLEEIIAYASAMRIWTSVVTNGSTLTRERIGRLKEAGFCSYPWIRSNLPSTINNGASLACMRTPLSACIGCRSYF